MKGKPRVLRVSEPVRSISIPAHELVSRPENLESTNLFICDLNC